MCFTLGYWGKESDPEIEKKKKNTILLSFLM